jgi:signal transduction histidine kinase
MLKSIQSRTLAALLLAVLVTAFLSAWLSYRSAKEMLVQESVRALRIAADAKKEELLLTVKRQEDRALAFLENNLIDCLEIRDVRCVKVNLGNFASAEQALGAMAGVHGGRKISVGQASGLTDLPDRGSVLLEAERDGRRTYIIYAHSDTANADIAVRFNSAQIDPLFSQHANHLGEGGDLFLVDSTSMFFSRTTPSEVEHASSAPMKACLAGHDGEATATDYRGRRVVMSYRYLPELGGGCIMAHIDESVMLLPAKRLRYEMMAIAIPMVILATLFAILLGRRITRPLSILSDRVRRLQRGDFDSTISIHGPAEIQTFAETFATMVQSLKKSREQERLIGEKLRQSEKLAAAGRLAATIAHEVNNPLGGAMNALFLLRDKVNDTGREMLNLAEEQLRRVAGITRQTLGFYRENASPVQFDLGTVVEELIATLTPKARNKSLDIETEIEQMQVIAVKGEIQQVIANLVTNAIDATPAQSKIRIRARRLQSTVYGDAVQISVGDQGPGIPSHLRKRIWEPFFTTKEDVGTGLGLWVCRQIIQRHHGTIHAHSTPRGTVFTMGLPQRNAKTTEAAS